MTVEDRIPAVAARRLVERLVRQTIRALQKMIDTKLSGDDSELANTWDEICVQVQFEESFYWHAYDATARAVVRAALERMSPVELEALWLRTEPGQDWLFEYADADDESGIPVDLEEKVDDVVAMVIATVYEKAEDWSNARIRTYLAR